MTPTMICLIAQFFQMQLQSVVTVQATPLAIGKMADYSSSECKKDLEKQKKEQEKKTSYDPKK